MINVCEYCNKETKEEDWIFDGSDYCCRDCAEDFCEYCGKLLTPGTSETYEGMCKSCYENYYLNDEYEDE